MGVIESIDLGVRYVSSVRRVCTDRVRLLGGSGGGDMTTVPLISRDQTRGLGLMRSPNAAERGVPKG